MTNLFGGLDDIDLEAMREGAAISRLQSHTSVARGRKVVANKEETKNRKKTKRKPPSVDILRILNIIQGKR